MLEALRKVQGIGQFESIGGSTPAALLGKFTVVFAENGRGKTTLCAICRSLACGDVSLITERKRLGSTSPPQVVIDCTGLPPANFQHNAWSRTQCNMHVFDDRFVEDNVYTGLQVTAENRKNLHELIIGEEGVRLAREYSRLTDLLSQLTGEVKAKATAIPATVRGNLQVDAFCALELPDHIETAIQTAQRQVDAHTDAAAVQSKSELPRLDIPAVDREALDELLARGLPTLNATTLAAVQAHFERLGTGGEQWISSGMDRLAPGETAPSCPFCAQPLKDSPIFAAYEAYFQQDYTALKQDIARAMTAVQATFGGDSLANFQQTVHRLEELQRYWSRFCDILPFPISMEALAAAWTAVRDVLLQALRQKQQAPLDACAFSPDDLRKIQRYQDVRDSIIEIDQAIQAANLEIAQVKTQTATGRSDIAARELAHLRTIKQRHAPPYTALCEAYLAAKRRHDEVEAEKTRAQDALNVHRDQVIRPYQDRINHYLRRFNAGFQITDVKASQPGGNPTSTYKIQINHVSVDANMHFKHTLSAGDRNALALAFFFASLDSDQNLGDKIVIIDDPVSSLDDHRELTTIEEICSLADRTAQLIVLSHDKPFLCQIWEHENLRPNRVALEVKYRSTGSVIQPWDVTDDCITEYDRDHARLREYIDPGTGDDRQVAATIRPVLEGFLRVAYPKHFPPGVLLRTFVNQAGNALANGNPIISSAGLEELKALKEFGNRYHHLTNMNYMREPINSGQVRSYVQRTLDFVTPR